MIVSMQMIECGVYDYLVYVLSLQSESPIGSRQSSLSRNSEHDKISQNSGDTVSTLT